MKAKSITEVWMITAGYGWPPKTGGEIRFNNIAKLINKIYPIHLVSFDENMSIDTSVQNLSIFRTIHSVKRSVPYKIDAGSKIRNILFDVMDSRPRQVRYISSREIMAIADRLSSRKDIIVWADTVWCASLFAKIRSCALVTDWDDIESIAAFRERKSMGDTSILNKFLHDINRAKISLLEQRIVRNNCVIVVASSDDAIHIKKIGGHPSKIPNGVEIINNNCPAEASPPYRILFPGTLNFGPNIEGLRWFLDGVWGKLKLKCRVDLIVAGRMPTRAVIEMCSRNDISLIADPPDMSPLFQQCHLVVVPIMRGAGTRIKILEALNHGRAVVSTSIGQEGLEMKDEEHLLIRDSPFDFLCACEKLLGNSVRRRQIAYNGWSYVRNKFIWDLFLPDIKIALDKAVELAI